MPTGTELIFAKPPPIAPPKYIPACVHAITVDRWGNFRKIFLGFAWIEKSALEKKDKILASFETTALDGYENGRVKVRPQTWNLIYERGRIVAVRAAKTK